MIRRLALESSIATMSAALAIFLLVKGEATAAAAAAMVAASMLCRGKRLVTAGPGGAGQGAGTGGAGKQGNPVGKIGKQGN